MLIFNKVIIINIYCKQAGLDPVPASSHLTLTATWWSDSCFHPYFTWDSSQVARDWMNLRWVTQLVWCRARTHTLTHLSLNSKILTIVLYCLENRQTSDFEGQRCLRASEFHISRVSAPSQDITEPISLQALSEGRRRTLDNTNDSYVRVVRFFGKLVLTSSLHFLFLSSRQNHCTTAFITHPVRGKTTPGAALKGIPLFAIGRTNPWTSARIFYKSALEPSLPPGISVQYLCSSCCHLGLTLLITAARDDHFQPARVAQGGRGWGDSWREEWLPSKIVSPKILCLWQLPRMHPLWSLDQVPMVITSLLDPHSVTESREAWRVF